MAKPKSKALTNVAKELAAEAANIAESIGAPATNAIKIHDKVFKLPDGQILQAPLKVVIIDFISCNKFYEGVYREGEINPPVCFAISKKVTDLTPSANSPKKQANSCDICPLNEFGSDGAGKACKNTRLLAVILPDLDDNNSIYTLSVSPTAIKGFDGYVGSVAKMYKAPPVRVITDVMFHPEKSYSSLLFGNPQPNENYIEDYARRADADVLLTAEPDMTSSATAKPKSKVRRKRA